MNINIKVTAYNEELLVVTNAIFDKSIYDEIYI